MHFIKTCYCSTEFHFTYIHQIQHGDDPFEELLQALTITQSVVRTSEGPLRHGPFLCWPPRVLPSRCVPSKPGKPNAGHPAQLSLPLPSHLFPGPAAEPRAPGAEKQRRRGCPRGQSADHFPGRPGISLIKLSNAEWAGVDWVRYPAARAAAVAAEWTSKRASERASERAALRETE